MRFGNENSMVSEEYTDLSCKKYSIVRRDGGMSQNTMP